MSKAKIRLETFETIYRIWRKAADLAFDARMWSDTHPDRAAVMLRAKLAKAALDEWMEENK